MGIFLSKLMSNLFGGIQARVVMLGLDAAGKTTILYKLKLNETVTTIPTIGFNVETVTPVKGLTFTVWDIGGQQKIRQLWNHYFQNVDGLIFVVDSSDWERIAEARQELHGILGNDEMRNVPVVVIANKQDLPRAMKLTDIVDGLEMRKLGGRKWHIQGTCATSGEGLYDAMDQLATMVKGYQNSRPGYLK